MDFDLDNIDFDEAEKSVEERREEIDSSTSLDSEEECEGCKI